MAAQQIDLSIVLPALNEEAIIGDTLHELAAYLQAHPEFGTTEIVVVAAGHDQTAHIARGFSTHFRHLQVITPPKKTGKGGDVRTGLRAAQGRLRLFMDADLSTPLQHIAGMVHSLEAGNDIVIGRRALNKIHKGRLRTFISVASNYFVRFLLLPGIGDSQCGFKGFTAAAVTDLFGEKQRISGWAFDIEVLAAARRGRYRIAQLPINDWHETRADDLRNDNVYHVMLVALREILGLRVSLWIHSLARHIHYLIAAATVVSFALMLSIGVRQSLWFDEAYTAALIQHPVSQLLHLTAVDVHPPLYYLVLKAWTAIFGTHDLALRSLSALFGASAVGVGLLLLKRIWGARTTLYALPFVIAAPFVIRYGFEVRMYAMASLICISGTYVLVAAQAAKQQKTRYILWVCYALLVATGVYTLYYAALVWAAHFFWCVYHTLKTRKLRPSALLREPWLGGFMLAIVLYLPWIPAFWQQLHTVQGGFWVGPANYHRVASVTSFFFSYLAEWQLDPMKSLIWMASLVTAVCFIVSAYQCAKAAQRTYLVLLAASTIIPVAILYCASLPPLQPVFLERYVSQAILATYLLLGIAVALVLRYRFSILKAIAALGLLCVLIQGVVTLSHAGNFNFEQLDKPTAREISAYLTDHAAANEAIMTDGAYSYIELIHYLPHHNLYFYAADPTSANGGYAMLHTSSRRIDTLDAFQSRPVWLVYRSEEPMQIPANHFRSYGTRIGKYHAYLYTYRAPRPVQA